MIEYPGYGTSFDLRAIDRFHAWLGQNQDHRMILQQSFGLGLLLLVMKEIELMEEVPPLQARKGRHNQSVGHKVSDSLLVECDYPNKKK